MYKFLIFAGTTEGREIVSYLSDKNVKMYVCVATEYGETLIEKSENITVSPQRLNKDEMKELIVKENFDLVIDTTHPYAVEVTANISAACKETQTKYLRLTRMSEKENDLNKDVVYVNSIEESIEYLNNTSGNILITTGSKELAKFTKAEAYKERMYARVLSTPQVVEQCSKLGFEGKHLICMQGPFNEEFNYALLKQISAKYMVTKESGKVGGYLDKINAAKRAGVVTIVIGRPADDLGYSYGQVLKILEDDYNIKGRRKVYLIGIGMGDYETMTIEGEHAFKECDVIIGARRMVEGLDRFNKPKFISYKYDEIKQFIDEHKEYKIIGIAYSGDVGFYSGAKKLSEMLAEEYDTEMICGISSVVYFASKIKKSWDDAKLVSIHGTNQNLVNEIIHNKKTFSLLGGKESVQEVCKSLIKYDLGNAEVYIGENLSYPNEKIYSGHAKDFVDSIFNELSVIFVINDKFKKRKSYCRLRDEDFIRGKVPMTKEEIRTLSVTKLELEEDSVVYDVGAGTGSVSIEMALNTRGNVYAIEKNPEGIELININKKKFKTSNLKIVEGVAPDAMRDLPTPTHAFIGGSSGNLREIINDLLDKNPNVRIVINAITLETIFEAMECIKEFSLEDVDITQASISKSRKLGKYNLMTGQNPIYVISCKGGVSDE